MAEFKMISKSPPGAVGLRSFVPINQRIIFLSHMYIGTYLV